MPSMNVCWGIEIGAAAIKAVKLEAVGDGQVKVVDFAVVPHPKVLSTPGVDRNDVLRVSLGAFASQFDLKGAQVAVSIPGHSAFARFAKLPPVEPKKVPDIVKFEAMQQIPFQLDDVEWDYQTFKIPDSPDIEVGIFAVTKERVNESLALLADFGIVPGHVVLSPIAVYNALAYDLEFGASMPGTIIVDVGTTSTDLVIATPGRMWVRTFPIGGHQFTEALVSAFQASYPKAEKLKREAEDSPYARQIFQAMRPVFTDLAQDIQRSIGYFQSIHKDVPLTRLIGVGSTFHLPGLRKYLKQQLSMDVYRIEQFKRAKVEGERAPSFSDSSLNLCTAYGLALQGLGLNAVSGNLMPVSIIRSSMWKAKVPWFGLAAGLAVAGSAAMFIRPFLDYLAVQDSKLSSEFQATVNRAMELKRSADEAGVTRAGEPDYTAANMLALLDGKKMYEQITADVGAMFDQATRKAAGWAESVGAQALPAGTPGMVITALSTTYEPPTNEMGFGEDPYAGSSGGGRGASMMGGGGGGGFGSTDLSSKLGITNLQRIKVEIAVKSAQPELRRFMRESVDRWLRANAKRDGAPYEIRFDDPPFVVLDASAPEPTGPGRAGASGVSAAEAAERAESERAASRFMGRVVGGEAPSSGESAALRNSTAARVDLDKLAAIAGSEDAAATTRATIVFYAVIVPAKSADEQGGGQ